MLGKSTVLLVTFLETPTMKLVGLAWYFIWLSKIGHYCQLCFLNIAAGFWLPLGQNSPCATVASFGVKKPTPLHCLVCLVISELACIGSNLWKPRACTGPGGCPAGGFLGHPPVWGQTGVWHCLLHTWPRVSGPGSPTCTLRATLPFAGFSSFIFCW